MICNNIIWRKFQEREDYGYKIHSKPIMIAKDIIYKNKTECKESKNYTNLNDFNELETLCKIDNHYFEILQHQVRKVYFDIDEWKYDSITIEEFNTILPPTLKAIGKELNKKIDITDVIILMNDDWKDCGVKSVHLIFKKIMMNYIQQKTLVKNYNLNTYGAVDRCAILDDTVYTEHRQFRLIYQSKIQSKMGGSYTFIEYNGNNRFIDTCITATDDCKIHKYKKDLITNQIELYEDDKKIRKYINESDIIDCIKNVNKSFWLNSNDWKMMIRIIKKLQIMDLEEFNKLSILNSDNKYKYEDNENFINTIDIQLVKSGIPLLLTIINKHTDNQFYLMKNLDRYSHNKNMLYEYLQINSQLKIDIPKLTQTNVKEVLNYEDSILINVKNGFIENTLTKKRSNFIYNKNLHIKEPKSYVSAHDNSINRVYINNLDDIEIKWEKSYDEKGREEVEKQPSKYLFIKSDWGTGKNYKILNKVMKYAVENNKTVCSITDNNALNLKQKQDYLEFGFKSHLDFQSENTKTKLKDYSIVGTSTQSLPKLKDKKYDIIIIDEFQSVFDGFINGIYDNGFPKLFCYKRFITLCKNSEKIVCLDADLDEQLVNMFLKVMADFPTKTPNNFYINNENKYSDYNINLFSNKHQHFQTALDQIKNNKKIVFGTAIKKYGDELFDEFKKIFNTTKRILYISKDGAVSNYEFKTGKKDTIQELEKHLVDIDVFIYSPTISVGISINNVSFDYAYMYGSMNSLPAVKFLQMWFRIRNITNKEINVYIDGWKYSENTITSNQIKHQTKNQTDLLKTQFEYDFNENQDFFELWCYVRSLSENSKKCYARELISLLNIHNLNYQFVYDTTINKDYILSLIQTQADIEKRKKINFIKAELMDYSEYEKYKTIQKNNPDDIVINDEIKHRLNKTNLLYNIHNIKQTMKPFKDYKNIMKTTDIKSDINNIVTNKIDYRKENDDILYLNLKTIQNVKCIRHYYNTNMSIEYQLTDDELNDYSNLHQKYILYNRLLESFYNPSSTKNKTYTNREFKQFVMDYKPLLILIYKNIKLDETGICNWIETYNNKIINDYNKEKIKSIYHTIKQIYKELDIDMKYISLSHVSMENDKFKLEPKYNCIKYIYSNKIDNKFKFFPNEHIENDYELIDNIEMDDKTVNKIINMSYKDRNRDNKKLNLQFKQLQMIWLKDEYLFDNIVKSITEWRDNGMVYNGIRYFYFTNPTDYPTNKNPQNLLRLYYKPTACYFNTIVDKINTYKESDLIIKRDDKQKRDRYYLKKDKKIEMYMRSECNGRKNIKPYQETITKKLNKIKLAKQYYQIPIEKYDYELQDILNNLNIVINKRENEKLFQTTIIDELINKNNLPKIFTSNDTRVIEHVVEKCKCKYQKLFGTQEPQVEDDNNVEDISILIDSSDEEYELDPTDYYDQIPSEYDDLDSE